MRSWILMGLLGALATAALARGALRRADSGRIALASGSVVAAAESITPLDASAGDAGSNASTSGAAPRTATILSRTPQMWPDLALARMDVGTPQATAPLSRGRVARLFVRPKLQRLAKKLLQAYRLPQACIVMVEPSTGHVLVWQSHVQNPPADRADELDVCASAAAPAASVFKVVTASALVEDAGLAPDTSQCYSGGESQIRAIDLVDDKKRDRWCATLSDAMGRSINTVFARLATKHLKPQQLSDMAARFGFGEPPPFDVSVDASTVHIPDDSLGFARTAAGFWNSTLSPLQGAMLASTVAEGGETIRPAIVESVSDNGIVTYQSQRAPSKGRAIRSETAQTITKMMESTVASGTSYRAFHDDAGTPFLPGISVAGKTGTLIRSSSGQFYTWFVGFAPSRAPEIAVSVLVVNHLKWRVKANVIAREMLRTFFADKGASGVTSPTFP